MTPKQTELFEILAEEAAEVVQCCMKILRHGMGSYNPDAVNSRTNIEHLGNELGEMQNIICRLMDCTPLIEWDIDQGNKNKDESMKKWSHNQGEING